MLAIKLCPPGAARGGRWRCAPQRNSHCACCAATPAKPAVALSLLPCPLPPLAPAGAQVASRWLCMVYKQAGAAHGA